MNKEKIPLSTQWIQLVESKGSERTCGLALCPVCQSDEEWEIRPFSLRQFYCSTGHSVPRCSLTLLPVGAEGVSVVKCSFCGSFQWQSVSFLGILSHFHLCPICSYDGIPDVS